MIKHTYLCVCVPFTKCIQNALLLCRSDQLLIMTNPDPGYPHGYHTIPNYRPLTLPLPNIIGQTVTKQPSCVSLVNYANKYGDNMLFVCKKVIFFMVHCKDPVIFFIQTRKLYKVSKSSKIFSNQDCLQRSLVKNFICLKDTGNYIAGFWVVIDKVPVTGTNLQHTQDFPSHLPKRVASCFLQ